MNQAIRGLQKNTPTHPTPRHWTWFHNLASPGVLFWCPTNGGVLFSHPFLKKGAVSNLFFFFCKTAPFSAKRGAVLQNSTPMHRGAFFSFSLIYLANVPPIGSGGGGSPEGLYLHVQIVLGMLMRLTFDPTLNKILVEFGHVNGQSWAKFVDIGQKMFLVKGTRT